MRKDGFIIILSIVIVVLWVKLNSKVNEVSLLIAQKSDLLEEISSTNIDLVNLEEENAKLSSKYEDCQSDLDDSQSDLDELQNNVNDINSQFQNTNWREVVPQVNNISTY